MTFSFGKNWQLFLKSCNEDRIRIARESLQEFTRLQDFHGKTFVDIGCGSGLFSLGAFQLGAERIISVDVDAFSVQCCQYLHEQARCPANWEIMEGSVLDEKFLYRLGVFDIVYSWGVLHHTGNMWQAIRNAANLVKKGGLYYIAIYNKMGGSIGSDFWLKIKKVYNFGPGFLRPILEFFYTAALLLREVVRGRNPMGYIRNYQKERGMNLATDVKDWLGGYPYEFASVDDIKTFMKTNFPEFQLINLKTTGSIGNNWFLFRRD